MLLFEDASCTRHRRLTGIGAADRPVTAARSAVTAHCVGSARPGRASGTRKGQRAGRRRHTWGPFNVSPVTEEQGHSWSAPHTLRKGRPPTGREPARSADHPPPSETPSGACAGLGTDATRPASTVRTPGESGPGCRLGFPISFREWVNSQAQNLKRMRITQLCVCVCVRTYVSCTGLRTHTRAHIHARVNMKNVPVEVGNGHNPAEPLHVDRR